MGSSRLQLKLIPATLMILKNVVKEGAPPPSNDPTERNVVAYHAMKAVVKVGEEDAKLFIIVKEDDKGAFFTRSLKTEMPCGELRVWRLNYFIR